MKRSFHRYRTFLHRIIFLFFFSFFSYITRLLLQRKRIFARSIYRFLAHPGGSNEFLPLDKIHDDDNSESDRVEIIFASRRGPFSRGGEMERKKICTSRIKRERERNRVNGISGPRSGSSTTTSGSKSDKLVAARESLNVARERERGRGWEQPQIDTSAAPSSRCCRDRYLIINRIPSAPRCSDTSQGR